MTRFVYTLLTYAMLPFALLHLLWRSLRQPAYLKHIPEQPFQLRAGFPAPQLMPAGRVCRYELRHG